MIEQIEAGEKLHEDDLVEVHRGRNRADNSEVTVRRLKNKLAHNQEAISRLNEVSPQVRSLAHPGLVAHLAFEPYQGSWYWLESARPGVSLDLVLTRLASREVRISPPAALRIGEDLALACGALHQAGLGLGLPVASDLLLGPEGKTSLAGVGFTWTLLHIKQVRPLVTRGRKDFLAPEQAQGRPPAPAGDVWSLSALIYLLLTGQSALSSASSVSTRSRQVTPPSRLNRSLPYACDAVFSNALAPSPVRRTADGNALAQALRRLRTSLPNTGQEESELARLARNIFPNEVRRGARTGKPLVAPATRGVQQQEATQPNASNPPPAPAPLANAAEEKPTVIQPPPPPAASSGAAPAHTAPPAGGEEPTRPQPPPPSPPPAPPASAPASVEAAATVQAGWSPVGASEEVVEAPTQTRQIPGVEIAFDREEDTDAETRAASASVTTSRHRQAAGPARGVKQMSWKRLALAGAVLLVAIFAVWLLLPAGSEPDVPAVSEPAATQIGFLSIEAGQPLVVFIDGERLKQGTPVRRKLLRAGPHRVVARTAQGRQLLNKIIEIEPGGHQQLQVIMPAPVMKKVRNPSRHKRHRRQRSLPRSRRRSRRRRR